MGNQTGQGDSIKVFFKDDNPLFFDNIKAILALFSIGTINRHQIIEETCKYKI